MRTSSDIQAKSDAAPERGTRALRVVLGSLEIGGAEEHLALVFPGLARLGREPQLVTLLSLGPIAEKLQSQGIPVRTLTSAARMRALPGWLRHEAGEPRLVADLCRELRARPTDITWMLLPEAYMLTMAAAAICRHRGGMVMSRRS